MRFFFKYFLERQQVAVMCQYVIYNVQVAHVCYPIVLLLLATLPLFKFKESAETSGSFYQYH